MTTLPDNHEDELDEAAAAWLFERDEGFTPARAREFDAWRRADPRHAQAIQDAERALVLLEELPSVRLDLEKRLEEQREDEELANSGGMARFRRLSWGGGIAAALFLGLVLWYVNTGNRDLPTERYATDNVVLQSMALQDSSLMDLNVDSEVAVRFTPRERRIQLQKGEAHFQVSHNANRPFIVTAGNVTVKAIGTAFSVRLTDDDVEVVVSEGKVELGRTLPESTLERAQPLPLLQAGQQAELDRGAEALPPKIKRLDAESLHAELAWQSSMVSFTDVPLIDVVTRLNRYSKIQLELADRELGFRKIGGKIATDQVDVFVRLLESDGEIVADRTTPNRIVLHRVK